MTSPWMWSHRLHNRPIISLSNLCLPHKAHLLIFITSGLPHMGNLSLDSGLGLPIKTRWMQKKTLVSDKPPDIRHGLHGSTASPEWASFLDSGGGLAHRSGISTAQQPEYRIAHRN